MKKRFRINPFVLPVVFFLATILIGAMMLYTEESVTRPISWVDALFTSTSAVCVTGLVVVDTGTAFTRFGQSVIMCLIQLGGLGIMTYTGLIFYLWRKRVSLTDRQAVGQSLLHDPSFKLGTFLVHMVLFVLGIEAVAAGILHALAPAAFPAFSAIFHSVSAFCNAGFSLYTDSLVGFRGDWRINILIMVLIIIGGLGFSVVMESRALLFTRLGWAPGVKRRKQFSQYSRMVIGTTVFLILAGWGTLFVAEFVGYHRTLTLAEATLSTLFQSVTCRTAGFNTLDIRQMTNVSLMIMIGLMFIGGAPGSCAGGIKVTTFRTLTAFVMSHIKGRQQTVIGKVAVDLPTLNKALSLLVFAAAIIGVAVMALTITEGGDIPHPKARGMLLELLFEAVSAFGTVGLTTGLTPTLSTSGKLIISALMFIGRLGPILLVTAIQGYQKKQRYYWPEENFMIG